MEKPRSHYLQPITYYIAYFNKIPVFFVGGENSSLEQDFKRKQ